MTDFPTGFNSGDRHGWLASWSATLSRISWGRAAERLLAAGVPSRCAVVLLPVWTWHEPIRDVGRKAMARGGGRLLLPVRVVWERGPVLLVSYRHPVTDRWTAEGLGLHLDGALTVAAADRRGTVLRVADDELPDRTRPGLLAQAAVQRELETLVADGRTAMWEAIALVTPFVEKAVTRAHAALSADVLGEAGGRLCSPTTLEQVASTLTLGDDGPLEQVPVVRIINRVLEPGSTVRVDPQRYVLVAVNGVAGEAVKRAVGDPRVGGRVREVARSLPYGAGVPEILAHYTRLHPRDRLGHRRATDALTVAPDPLASSWPLPATGSD